MTARVVLAVTLLAAGCRLASDPPAVELPPDALPEAPTDTVPEDGPPGTPPGVATPAAGGYVVPVVGVAPADLADTFDDARSEGRIHDALDILAPRGTPVVAATAGRVLRLFTSERGGLTVYQLGTDGRTVYYYAHLDAYAPGLAAGQRLAAGDPVGTVGETGNVAPGNPHLHFAVWTVADSTRFWDGANVNPYDLLTGRAPRVRADAPPAGTVLGDTAAGG